MAAFAIGLPKAQGDEADAEELTLTLPDTLPGGYVASDDPAAFEDGQLADQADEIAKQEKANREYGNAVLPEALGTSAATRTYVVNGTEAVFVQVFQSEGGAFAPNSLPDPANTGGQAGTEMKAVGDGACILTYGQAQAEGQAPPVAFSQCQVSHGRADRADRLVVRGRRGPGRCRGRPAEDLRRGLTLALGRRSGPVDDDLVADLHLAEEVRDAVVVTDVDAAVRGPGVPDRGEVRRVVHGLPAGRRTSRTASPTRRAWTRGRRS